MFTRPEDKKTPEDILKSIRIRVSGKKANRFVKFITKRVSCVIVYRTLLKYTIRKQHLIME